MACGEFVVIPPGVIGIRKSEEATTRKYKMLLGCFALTGLAMIACSSGEDSQSSTDSLTLNQVYVDHSGNILSQNVYELSKLGKVLAYRQLDKSGNVVHEASASEIETATISVDSSCASSDLMMFDQTGYGGNRLCVYVSGGTTGQQACLNLQFTLRVKQGCCNWLNWANAVKSFKSNNQHGFFWEPTTMPCDPSGLTCEGTFTTSDDESTADGCTQSSTSLTLTE